MGVVLYSADFLPDVRQPLLELEWCDVEFANLVRFQDISRVVEMASLVKSDSELRFSRILSTARYKVFSASCSIFYK